MIFIDSGAIIARYIVSDDKHCLSLSFWAKLEKDSLPLVTSSLVLAESITYLSRRMGNYFAVQRIQAIYQSRAFRVLRPEEEDELLALSLMEKYADQKVGFTDCVSFVLMKRERIKRVFTFDRHFEYAGFTVVP